MMSRRILFFLLLIGVGIFASALPSQPAHATAQIGFSSAGFANTSYNASFYEFAFTFLTNSTVDEIVSVDIRVVGSSSMTLSLYNSDAAGNRGTFITNIATLPITTEQIYNFIPATPILLQPNSYYWIEIDFPVGGFGAGALPTSDYYTFGKSWLYEISSATYFDVPVAPFPTLRINTLDTPPVTVLGCALDTADGVEIANAPDNTYCRILMKDSAVVDYNGAIPANLIELGVILAVDVYRLEGGMSINTFPDYARICLAGEGRLFYMDARQAPRVSIELTAEIEGSLTCGWIPAPGTLILTN
jgi:hypothetical protein